MNKKKLIILLTLSPLIALSSVSLVLGQSDEQVKAQGYASVDGVRPGDKFKIAVALEIANGFHINSNKPADENLIPTAVKFELPPGIRIVDEKYPGAQLRKFSFSEKELAVYEGTVYVIASAEADKAVQQSAATIRASVTVQACNDELCFAPADIPVEIPVKIVAATEAVNEINANVFSAQLVEYKSGAETNDIAKLIASKGIVVALLGIFVAGLALNLTPCVYPIIPITVGFFVNQSESEEGKPRLRRSFTLAAMYVLGMALTYSVLGVVASLSKGLFGAALQNPIVLVNLAAIMVALSLSMFGVYEFKVPESLNRFATKSAQSTGGVIGALVMGLTMGIVAAPCIGPFVVALLVFVGEKGDPLFGFLMFFILALGLGLPYLVLGTFSSAVKALPRSGLWMVTVRKVFGLVLIGMALYFLMPLMGDGAKYVFIEFFALSAIYLIFFEAGKTKQRQFGWVLRAIGVGAAAVAIWMGWPRPPQPEIAWQPYSEQAMDTAVKEGRGVIIDAYADWCIPCKELDRYTFTDPNVYRESERFVRLKLNLTRPEKNSAEERARDRFNIKGVPTVIFIDGAGREHEQLRLAGFEEADAFLARMKQVEFKPAASSQALAQNTATANGTKTDATPGAATGAGEPMPALRLSLLDGKTVDTQSLRGKVVVLSFWATWCVPCISEIPIFNQLNTAYKDRGLELIAVSYPDEGADKVKPFLKQHPMNYTQALGNEEMSRLLNTGDDRPVTIIVDKQGRIRFRHDKLEKKEVLESEITQLLNE